MRLAYPSAMIRIILSALVILIGTPALSEPASQAWPKPWVIAHRGASGERPEHTAAAYDLAIDQGADMIEPDLVMTKDGVLVARHENEIGETTDVADRPEFADRRITRTIDGRGVTGWFTEDFTLAELQTLRTRERLPQLRPANTAHDGEGTILTFQQVLDIARVGSSRTGRVIGVAPELKHPTYFADRGLPMEDAFVELLTINGLTGADAPVLIQCFEVGPLQRLALRIDTPLLQLIGGSGGPADRSDLTYAAMATPQGLAAVAAYADAVGVETTLVIPRNAANAPLTSTSLVTDAHAAGLKVIAWTFRAENYFLAELDRRGDPARLDYLRLPGDLSVSLKAFYALGVDGVFTDFPAAGVAAR